MNLFTVFAILPILLSQYQVDKWTCSQCLPFFFITFYPNTRQTNEVVHSVCYFSVLFIRISGRHKLTCSQCLPFFRFFIPIPCKLMNLLTVFVIFQYFLSHYQVDKWTCSQCLLFFSTFIQISGRQMNMFSVFTNFRWKTLVFFIFLLGIFHIYAQNIDCGYMLELTQWDGFNMYPQSMFFFSKIRIFFVCVLRFYGPVNPMGSCRVRSVYLTTRLLGRLSPLSG